MVIIYRDPAKRRKKRVRAKIKGKTQTLRLSVFRSHRYIYAQIIDDQAAKTLVSISEKDISFSGKLTKTEKAKLVGMALAKKALKKKIKKVKFDRGSYRFHGRVKALAAGARQAGLEF